MYCEAKTSVTSWTKLVTVNAAFAKMNKLGLALRVAVINTAHKI
jgi:hypothetical protein